MSTDPRQKRIFLEAIDRDETERETYLAEACGDDAALLEAVRALIAADQNAERVFDERQLGIASRRDRIAPGAVVADRYEIETEVGEGGFGIVYRARQHTPLRRTVALKVIKRGMDTRRVIARFGAERETLALMNHESIARVIDAGETHDGRPFFVMEFVDGVRIDTFCREHELSLEARLELLQQVCRAIQHAHQKGVLHRDLKPSNVLVVDTEQGPLAKVIDFGIGKALDETRDEGAMTRTGELVGTPAYMSPEQAAGQSDVDTRSDVYTIGVLLYELLTGVAPFAAAAGGGHYADVLRRVLEDEPTRPSARLVETTISHRPSFTPRDLRDELDWIVMKCLAKDREQRYGTASEIAEEIARYLDGRPILAGPPSATYLLRKFVQRHRAAIAVAVAFVVLLVGGSIAVTTWAFRAQAAETAALTAKQSAEYELAKFEEIARFTQDMLTSIDPAVARGADTAILRDMLQRARDRIAEAPPDKRVVEASLRSTIGFAYQQIGDYATATEEFTRTLEIARELHGDEALDTIRAHRNRVVAMFSDSKHRELEPEIRELLALAERTIGTTAELTLALEGVLAATLARLGKLEEAERRFRSVLARRRAADPPNVSDVLTTMNNLAMMLDDAGKIDESIALNEEVLAAQRQRLGDDHPKTLATMNNLAESYSMSGRHAEAIALSKQALVIKRPILGDDHPSTIVGILNLARKLGRHGDADEAERLFAEGRALALAHLSPGHLYALASGTNFARFYLDHGRFADARTLYEDVLPELRTELGADHASTLTSTSSYAIALAGVGELDRAIEVIDDVVRRAESALDADDWRRAVLDRSRGRILLRAGRFDAAERALLQSHEDLSRLRAGQPRFARSCAELLVELYETTSRPAEAAAWRKRQ